MSSIKDDLKLSVERMKEIRCLVSPPTCLSSPPPVGRGRNAWRNNALCDSCGEKGDLIGCTICPAAFHLICHDPPLTKDDLPLKKWLCCRCKATRDVETQSHSSSPQCVDSDVINPFNVLINEALTSNPSQYQLPSELIINPNFPGSIKPEPKRKRVLKESVFPVPLCYLCNRSSLHAPLIQCDYCPLLFHCDCLDPPLTNPPGSSKWMCPNHSEHVLDKKILKCVSLTKRTRLWKKVAVPVNQDAIKLKFINKINTRYPPFRSKVVQQRKNTKWFYKISNLQQEVAKHCPTIQAILGTTQFPIKTEIGDASKATIKIESCDTDKARIKTEIYYSTDKASDASDISSVPQSDGAIASTSQCEAVVSCSYNSHASTSAELLPLPVKREDSPSLIEKSHEPSYQEDSPSKKLKSTPEYLEKILNILQVDNPDNSLSRKLDLTPESFEKIIDYLTNTPNGLEVNKDVMEFIRMCVYQYLQSKLPHSNENETESPASNLPAESQQFPPHAGS